jgi:hypothetical protein
MTHREPPPEFADWSSACDALAAAFTGLRGDPGGFALHFRDATACHFERTDDGPNAELLGIDWVAGVVRWGDMYLPKQDGGYHSARPLPPAWLAALRRLRRDTWGEVPCRFDTPAAAGPALLAAAAPEAREWVECPFTDLAGEGGPLDVLWVPAGHPLDALALCLDRTARTVTALLVDADGPVTPLGTASLDAALAADLNAPATGWRPGHPRESLDDGRLAVLVAAEARTKAAGNDGHTAAGPIAALVTAAGPARWQMPGAGIDFGGPAWRFVDGVPHTTVYGRFRANQAWVGVAFTPDFARATFVENALGPRPAKSWGHVEFDAADPRVAALRAAYAHR